VSGSKKYANHALKREENENAFRLCAYYNPGQNDGKYVECSYF